MSDPKTRSFSANVPFLRVSATKGEGLDAWLDWVKGAARVARSRRIRGAVGTGCGASCTCA